MVFNWIKQQLNVFTFLALFYNTVSGYHYKLLNWPEFFIPDTLLCMKPTVFTVLALLATVGGYNSKFPKLTRKSAVNPWNIYLTPMSKRTQIPLLLWYTSAQKNSKFGVLSLIYSQLNTLWEITIYIHDLMTLFAKFVGLIQNIIIRYRLGLQLS